MIAITSEPELRSSSKIKVKKNQTVGFEKILEEISKYWNNLETYKKFQINFREILDKFYKNFEESPANFQEHFEGVLRQFRRNLLQTSRRNFRKILIHLL